MSEARLQCECVVWYKNTFPDKGDFLWATMNEGRDVNTKLCMGMTAGVSDLLYCPDGILRAFELKLEGTRHSVRHLLRQCAWIRNVTGAKGWFITSLEEFQRAIAGNTEGLITPDDVERYCRRAKGMSVIWKREAILDGK